KKLPNASIMIQRLNAANKVQNAQGLRLEIPDTPWEFGLLEDLEKRTKKVGLPNLRTVVLPDHDLEMRFWFDRLEDNDCVILQRSGGKWSDIYLPPIHQPLSVKADSINLGPPVSGWEAVWTRLVSAGILTLPDGYSKEICNPGVIDGIGYTVETNINREYR